MKRYSTKNEAVVQADRRAKNDSRDFIVVEHNGAYYVGVGTNTHTVYTARGRN